MVFIVGSESTLSSVEPKALLFLFLSGLTTGASWLCYFKALQSGDVNKVTPIDKSSTVLTMILAFLLLGEEITALKIIGMVAIGIGTYMMITKKRDPQKTPSDRKWLICAVLSAVFAALTSILGKIGIQGVESNLGTALRTAVVLIMAWAVVFITKKQNTLKVIDKKSMLFILLSGVTTGASWLCYYRALQTGDACIVAPIDKLSILLTVAFAYFFLKEKLSRKALIGLIIIVAGTLSLLIKL
jgi:transporter family protein